jgi:hypothetical protein
MEQQTFHEALTQALHTAPSAKPVSFHDFSITEDNETLHEKAKVFLSENGVTFSESKNTLLFEHSGSRRALQVIRLHQGKASVAIA